MNIKPGLGRLPAIDNRDALYHMARALPSGKPPVNQRTWSAEGWWGDQDNTSECVAFSWMHWIEDGPITHSGVAPIIQPLDLYNEAQKIDEWAGTPHDGTSVRAGAKVLQAKGLIKEYLWAYDVDTIVQALLTVGPVEVGTDWYTSMFSPDTKGLIKISGHVEGGHAYVLDGVNKKTSLIRIKNSWGRSWGKNGFAFIKFKDMDRLIKQQGEACLATEIKT